MESFEQLAEQYTPMINKIMNTLNIYKNREEFFQHGLIGLWEARQRFNSEKGKFINYAYTYIKGKLLTELIKSKRYLEHSVNLNEEFWEQIEDPASHQPFMDTLLHFYYDDLTPNQKKWVLYTCLDALSISKIAEKENVSISAVKAWRMGAIKKLKRRLQE